MENFSSGFRRRHVRDMGCHGYAMGVAMCCTILAACSGQSPGTVSGSAAAQAAAPVVVTRASAAEGSGALVMRYAGGEAHDASAYTTLAPSAQPAQTKAAAAEIVIERELGTASDGGYMAY